MREDPEGVAILEFGDPRGEQAYAIAERQIDRTAGTAVLTLRWRAAG